jgi:hypothetical protein
MKSNDQKKQAREVVSERLRLFFSQLRRQLATSTDSFWKRVASKLGEGEKRP